MISCPRVVSLSLSRSRANAGVILVIIFTLLRVSRGIFNADSVNCNAGGRETTIIAVFVQSY